MASTGVFCLTFSPPLRRPEWVCPCSYRRKVANFLLPLLLTLFFLSTLMFLPAAVLLPSLLASLVLSLPFVSVLLRLQLNLTLLSLLCLIFAYPSGSPLRLFAQVENWTWRARPRSCSDHASSFKYGHHRVSRFHRQIRTPNSTCKYKLNHTHA
jgi:hypothetical protein